MAKIMIECGNPNDYSEIVEAAEKAAGSCTVTYAKVAQEKIEAGQAASIREAARQMAEETGETEETVRNKVRRGMGQVDPKPQPSETKTETTKSNEIKREPAKDGTMRGGSRPGAGRKTKDSRQEKPRWPRPEKELMSDEVKKAWEALFTQLKNEKHLNWKDTSQATAVQYINILYDVATIR